MKNVSPLEEKLGVVFANKDLLLQALTHRSYLNENPDFELGHNERLEFLGDAVLELVVTEELYKQFPDKPEGDLTSFRAALVNANMLADVASNLGVNDFLLLSRGEAKDTGRARQYIMANAFEAIIGAIYLDQQYPGSQEFIHRVLLPNLTEVLEKKLYKDPKSLFQESAQEHAGITPTYEVIREWGPDHDKHFIVGIYLNEELVAEGEGRSKQAAQEEAARKGLEAKQWN
ncbi:MAG: ribonuclease III [bacterium]|nr:ribonuclease III [bacterium]MDZ4286165.1 ribonuclease III [Candidatus Sungbacteria bacterium]